MGRQSRGHRPFSRKPDHVPTRNNRRQTKEGGGRRGGEIWKEDYFSARSSNINARRGESFSRGREPTRSRRNLSGSSTHAGRGRGRGATRRTANQPKPTKKLQPIQSSKSSIHNDWKEKYGGLIRYYVNYIKEKKQHT